MHRRKNKIRPRVLAKASSRYKFACANALFSARDFLHVPRRLFNRYIEDVYRRSMYIGMHIENPRKRESAKREEHRLLARADRENPLFCISTLPRKLQRQTGNTPRPSACPAGESAPAEFRSLRKLPVEQSSARASARSNWHSAAACGCIARG